MSTAPQKRILVVIPRMPFPLNSGGRIATYDTISSLSKRYLLTLVIIDDDKESKKHIAELERFSDDIHFFTAPRYRFYLNAVSGFLTRKPLQVSYFYFREVQALVNMLSQRCDIFYAFVIRTTSYGLKLNLKKGHYGIDSMYLNYKKSQEKTTSFFWKLIYNIEVPLLYKTELNQIRKFDLTTFVNRDEAAYWKLEGMVSTLPHGVNNDMLQYSVTDAKYGKVIAFLGRMDYQPNIDAVSWFYRNVLPQLPEALEFWIIGGYAANEIIEMGEKNKRVKVMGFVDDPNIILRSALCTVAPMQSGGGLQTKILVAMAVEGLVISSSLSAQAIEDAKNGVNMIITDDADEYVRVIQSIYSNPDAYTAVRRAARELISKTYSCEVIETKLFDLFDKYLN